MRLFLVSSAVGLALNAYGSVMDDFAYAYSKGNRCIFAKTPDEAQTIYKNNKNKDSYDSVADNAFGTTIDGKTTLKNSFRVSHWLVNMAGEILEKKEMEKAFNGIKYENLRFRGEKISYTIIEKLLNKSNLKANNDPDKNVIDDANMYYDRWYLKDRFDFENELNEKIDNIENKNLKKFCKIVQSYSKHTDKRVFNQNLNIIKRELSLLFHPDKENGLNNDKKTLKKMIEKETGQTGNDVLITVRDSNINWNLTFSELVNSSSKRNKSGVFGYEELSRVESVTSKEQISAEDIGSYKRIEDCFSNFRLRDNHCFQFKSIELPESLEFISEEEFSFHSTGKLEKIIIPDSWQIRTANDKENFYSFVYFITNSSVFKLKLRKEIKIFKHNGKAVTPTKLISKNGDGYYSLNIGDNIKKIECNVKLSNKGELEKLKLPDSLEEIDGDCFSDYENLETIKFGNNLKKLGNKVFNGCTKLNEVSLPETLEEIGSGCFGHCEDLKTVKIGKNLKKLGSLVFSGCTKLNEVSLPDTLEEIGSGCFENCKNLKSIELGKNFKKLDYDVFIGCASLETVINRGRWQALNDSFYKAPGVADVKIYTYLHEEDFTSGYLIKGTIMEGLLKNLKNTFKRRGSLIIKNSEDKIVGFIGNYSLFQKLKTNRNISDDIIKNFPSNFKVWFIMNDVYEANLKNGQLNIPAECQYIFFTKPDQSSADYEKYAAIEKKIKSIKFNGKSLFILESECKNIFSECSFVSNDVYSEDILNFTYNLKSVQKVFFAGKDCSIGKVNNSSNKIKNNILFTSMIEEDKKKVDELHIHDGDEIDEVDPDKKGYNKSGFVTIGNILKNYKNIKNIVIDFKLSYDYNDDIQEIFEELKERITGDIKENCKGNYDIVYRTDLSKYIYNPKNIKKMTTINGGKAIVDISKYKDNGFYIPSKICICDYLIECINSVCNGRNVTEVELILPNDVPIRFSSSINSFPKSKINKIKIDDKNPKELEIEGGYLKEGDICRLFHQLKSFDFGKKNKLTKIPDYLFQSCKELEEVVLPENLEEIGDFVFNCCSSIEEINLPDTLKILGESAFAWCVKLKKINLPYGLKIIGENCFSNAWKIEQVIQQSSGKASGTNELTIYSKTSTESKGLIVKEGAFFGCHELKEVQLPYARIIGAKAFYECTKLSLAVLPNIKEIGFESFGFTIDGHTNQLTIKTGENASALTILDSAFKNRDSYHYTITDK